MRDQQTKHGARFVDLFAGAGGVSVGYLMATDRHPDIAVNHNPVAIAIHAANHPGTVHFIEDVFTVDPRQVGRVGHVHASPTCTHFSVAKGAALKDSRLRGQAWALLPWALWAEPETMTLENVPEFVTWAPLDDDGQVVHAERGRTFAAFVACLSSGIAPGHPDLPEIVAALGPDFPLERLYKGLGYRVEWRVLVARDFGPPTIRKRLYMIMARHGRAIVWPKPTHGNPAAPGFAQSGLLPWQQFSDCVDWSIPVESIFNRARPLADATLRRIAHGVVRYVIKAQSPFLLDAGRVPGPGNDNAEQVACFLAKHYSGVIGTAMHDSIGTITTIDHHSLVAVYLTKFRGTNIGAAVSDALHTISAQGQHHGLVCAFLVKYYGSEQASHAIDDALGTVTTHDRFGLGLVRLGGEPYQITDICMRMLSPRELARAQGFPDWYVLDPLHEGRRVSKRAQIAGIGNSVVPAVMAAILRANLPDSPVKGAMQDAK